MAIPYAKPLEDAVLLDAARIVMAGAQGAHPLTMARLAPAYDTAALKRSARQHLWLAFSRWDELEAEDGPTVLVGGKGCRVFDSDGRSYLDGISALEAMVAGHGRQELIDAATEQLRQLAFLDVFRYASVPAIALAERLAALAPGSLSRVHFTPGGSEADETAIKVARQYFYLRGEPRRQKVITRAGAFHGVTFGAMGLDGNYFATRNYMFEPGVPFCRIAPAPACPRCDFGKAGRHLACPHKIEEIILAERPETVAAVVVDPAATSIAVAIPPPTYMMQLREICDRYGVLLVADEIITGFGRTGRMFCCEHSGVVPDIMTISKGLSSGYMPIGAAIVKEEIASAFSGRPEATLSHGQTYGGHPVACAVALENIGLIERERLPTRAAEMGMYLLEGLQSLHDHPSFWDARGIGLLTGLELVADRATGRIFSQPAAFGTALRKRCRDRGLLTLILHPGNVLFLAPPLVITRSEIDEMIKIVDEALAEVEGSYRDV
jgi:adenosylmethionine-8-amino-7-oxononanoate aminotransferase